MLDQFAILTDELSASPGATIAVTCSDGSNRADVGITSLVQANGPIAIAGTLRFQQAVDIIGSGPVTASAETANDSMVGIIAAIPSIIDGFFLQSLAARPLPAAASAVTLFVYPGISLVSGNMLWNGVTIQFAGSASDEYTILIAGSCDLVGCSFASTPPNLLVVMTGSLFVQLTSLQAYSGSWLVGSETPVPSTGNYGVEISGGALTMHGRFLNALNGFVGDFTVSASTLVIVMPTYLNPSVIDPDSLQLSVLPDPRRCAA
jgi:hypothetical protein